MHKRYQYDDQYKFEKFNLIVQPIASVVTTISVGFIVYQVYIAGNAFEAQGWQNISGQMHEIDKIFVEHPDLYPYFYQNKSITQEDPQYSKVAAIAELLLDFMDVFEDDYIRGLGGMDDKGSSWTAWRSYFEDQFRASPILCSRFREVESWYKKGGIVYKLATEGCKNAASSNIPLPSPQNGQSVPSNT